jgi:hypothetical protein
MDLAYPATGRQPFEVLRNERAQQYRRHRGLGDAMRNRQPRAAQRGPPDGLTAAELTCGVEEPVDVEGDAAPMQEPGEGGEHGSLPRSRRASNDEKRLDRGGGINPAAFGARSKALARLHDDRAVTGLAVVHSHSMP